MKRTRASGAYWILLVVQRDEGKCLKIIDAVIHYINEIKGCCSFFQKAFSAHLHVCQIPVRIYNRREGKEAIV
jgi:hypothetical protein